MVFGLLTSHAYNKKAYLDFLIYLRWT